MGYKARPTITRPANVTAYGAGAVIGGVSTAVIQFTPAGTQGGCSVIVSAGLQINVTAIPSGMTSFTLHLYDTSPPSALTNGQTWTQALADLPYYLGNIPLGSPALQAAGSGALWTQVDSVIKEVQLAGGSQSIFGYLVTNGAFTPAANSEVYQPLLMLTDA